MDLNTGIVAPMQLAFLRCYHNIRAPDLVYFFIPDIFASSMHVSLTKRWLLAD
jgi:hypothetical protein